jgi:hypothetical protein
VLQDADHDALSYRSAPSARVRPVPRAFIAERTFEVRDEKRHPAIVHQVVTHTEDDDRPTSAPSNERIPRARTRETSVCWRRTSARGCDPARRTASYLRQHGSGGAATTPPTSTGTGGSRLDQKGSKRQLRTSRTVAHAPANGGVRSSAAPNCVETVPRVDRARAPQRTTRDTASDSAATVLVLANACPKTSSPQDRSLHPNMGSIGRS